MTAPKRKILRGFFKGPKKERFMELILTEETSIEIASKELRNRWPEINFTRFEEVL